MDDRKYNPPSTNPNDEKRQAMSIRSVATEMAIKAGIGTAYDTDGRQIADADRIVAAAKKFETFIKGEV